jgi:hypothetical protein
VVRRAIAATGVGGDRKKRRGTENRRDQGYRPNYPAPSFLRTQLLAMLVYSPSLDIIESGDEDIDSDIAEPRASSDGPLLPICSRRR